MTNPLVSIIIPTYNRGNLIKDTLDSVLNQTYKNWECIIVDDGSTDNSAQVISGFLEKDKRFKYCKRPTGKPKGGNASRNYGFKLSRGEYVKWFDDDDVMLKDFLKTKIEAFTDGVNFVISSHYNTDENLKKTIKLDLKEESYLFKDYLSWKLKIITGSVLFKRDYLLDKKLFHEDLVRGQETELFSRLFFKIPKNTYKLLNSPLFLYRQHSKTKSNKNIKYIKKYRESQSYTAIEILKKSIELEDKALVNMYFDYLIDAFFRSVENKHYTNAKFIKKHLFAIIRLKRPLFSVEFIILSNIFVFFSRGIYKIEKRWKLKNIDCI